jgi:hypothetical protein
MNEEKGKVLATSSDYEAAQQNGFERQIEALEKRIVAAFESLKQPEPEPEPLVITESRLTELVEGSVKRVLGVATPPSLKTVAGAKAASEYLTAMGYRTSVSLIQKASASGDIPRVKYHGRHILFKGSELLAWAERHCEQMGVEDSEVSSAIEKKAKDRAKRLKKLKKLKK